METRIGFIGLGRMGHAMADNLLTAGYSLSVYNRTPEKAEALVTRGAALADDPAQTAEPGGMVITMLSDDHALESVTLGENGFLPRLGPHGIHLSMSTISPRLARRLVHDHQRSHVAYLAAPVFGRPDAAAARKLWICISGPSAAKERARPVLKAMGQGIFDFGEEPSAAHVAKAAGNFLLAAMMEALAEALTLGEKNGIDRSALADMFSNTLFACPAYQVYGKAIAEGRYQPPGFTVTLGLKDLNLVLDTAAMSTMPMPLASLLYDRFLATIAKGWGHLDWAAVALGVAQDAGLAPTHIGDKRE
ncbi:MAG TPA: NAD(P)-dependent oxidoreductase [Nitrospiraceae bacterium]|nr:NAD(P)-dependent oxidoreductase [Nitrospiraceae bacterium]